MPAPASLITTPIYNNMLTPYDVGAFGDGVHDDTAALQTWVDSLIRSSHSAGWLPAGNFLIHDTIRIKVSNISIFGSGWNSVITCANAMNTYALTFQEVNSLGISGCVLSNFKIDANCTNQTLGGGGIDANGAYRNLFDYIWVHNPFTAGIHLHFGPGGAFGFQNFIRNCHIEGGKNSTAEGRGLWIDNSDENHILDCHFQDNGGGNGNDNFHVRDENGLNDYIGNDFVNGKGGIKCYAATTGNRIIGNVFDGLAQGNVVLSGSGSNVIQGNRFLNIGFGAAAPNTADGVYSSGVGNIISGNFFNPEGSGTNGCKAQVELDGTNGESFNILSLNYFSAINVGGANILIDGAPAGNVNINNITR